MHGSVWLLHNLSLVFVSGFGGEEEESFFVGKIMGIYHPLYTNWRGEMQESEMAGGKLCRRCYYSQRGTFGFALCVGESETQKGEIESIEKFFFGLRFLGLFCFWQVMEAYQGR